MERLTEADSRILALERGNIRGHTMKLVMAGGAVSADSLREQVDARLDLMPRLRMRLAEGSEPALVQDTNFSVTNHVRAGANDPLDERGLLAAVARLMETRLDRARPLWAVDVLPLTGGSSAVALRMHHAVADGTVILHAVRSLLLDGDAEPAPAAARLPAAHAPMPSVLRRELAPRVPRSPLDRKAGHRREVAFVETDLARVVAIGHGAPVRATVNDVALAGVAGGLRRWLAQCGVTLADLRIKVPVSLHEPGDEAANVDSFTFVDVPLEHTDPMERLCAIATETTERKRARDAETIDEFFHDLSHLSGSLERFAEHWAMSPRVFTLNVSNVRGPAGPLSMMGSPVTAIRSLAEISHHHALRVAVLSAAGRLSFGLCSDPGAVDGLDVIAAGIEEELGELDRARTG